MDDKIVTFQLKIEKSDADLIGKQDPDRVFGESLDKEQSAQVMFADVKAPFEQGSFKGGIKNSCFAGINICNT